MNDVDFTAWLTTCGNRQVKAISSMRKLIKENTNNLEETVNQGKWLHGYIFYSHQSQMIFALAPRGTTKTTLHMMPFYGSKELQLRHQNALAPFLTGKSCIAFKDFSELPLENLQNIVKEGTKKFLDRV